MKWDKRSRLLKISTYAIIICFILAVVIAGFTIYGNKVGNFVISVDKKNNVNLALAEQEDRSDLTVRLAAKGADNQTLATLSDIPKQISAGMGIKNETVARPHYLAYSFYLINETDRMVDYKIEIDILESKLNVENVVRVMLIQNENERGDVFAMPKEDGTPEDHSDLGTQEKFGEPYTTIPFVTKTKVCEQTVTGFESKAYIKYTVVVWLEGWDDQATDDIQGGSVRMALNFTGF